MYTKVEFEQDHHSAIPPRLDDAIAFVMQQEISQLEAAPLPTRIALLLSRHATERKCRAAGEARRPSRLTEGPEHMPMAFFSPADLAAG